MEKNARLTILLTKTQLERLRYFAETDERPVSVWCKRALMDLLDTLENPTKNTQVVAKESGSSTEKYRDIVAKLTKAKSDYE